MYKVLFMSHNIYESLGQQMTLLHVLLGKALYH